MTITSASMANQCQQISTLRRYSMLFLAGLFYFYEFCLQVSPSVMVPDLMKAFHTGTAGVGNLGGIYFYAYALIQIPVGMLVDRFGVRRLLTAACVLCVLGCFCFGIAHRYALAALGRVLIGIGGGFAVVSYLKLAATWFSLRRFAFLTGLMLTVGMSGAISGETLLAGFVETIGWRHTFSLLTAFGAVLCIVIWYVLMDPALEKPAHPSTQEKHPRAATGLLEGMPRILKNPQMWLAALYGGLMFAPTSALPGLWGLSFLAQKYHITRLEAGSIVSSAFVGWAVGAPLMGWFSDFIQRRKPVLWMGCIGTLATLLACIYAPINKQWMVILLFLFGATSSGFMPVYSLARELNPPQFSANAMGFMNMLNMIGGAILQPAIGYLLDLHWQGAHSANGTRFYAISNYHVALVALPLVVAASIFILPFVKETFCRQVES